MCRNQSQDIGNRWLYHRNIKMSGREREREEKSTRIQEKCTERERRREMETKRDSEIKRSSEKKEHIMIEKGRRREGREQWRNID